MNLRVKSVLLVTFLLAGCAWLPSQAGRSDPGLHNFGAIENGKICRSAQPEYPRGYETFRQQGGKTVINLRNDWDERQAVKKAGLTPVWFRLDPGDPPTLGEHRTDSKDNSRFGQPAGIGPLQARPGPDRPRYCELPHHRRPLDLQTGIRGIEELCLRRCRGTQADRKTPEGSSGKIRPGRVAKSPGFHRSSKNLPLIPNPSPAAIG